MSHDRIDWSQLWNPGPSREFSAREMVRAAGPGPSRTLVVLGGINVALVAFIVLQFAPPQATARLTALMLAFTLFAWFVARRLWRDPSRRALKRLSWLYGLAGLAFGLGMRWRLAAGPEREWAFGVCLGATLLVAIALLVLALVRAEQIAARLRELDERERRDDMARQLAQAQIQPHFLFNSLASLQHWVQSKDDRGAQASLTLSQAGGGLARIECPLNPPTPP